MMQHTLIFDSEAVQVIYAWDNGAEKNSCCRLLHTAAGHYFLHRGNIPREGEEVTVFGVPTSVAQELRRLAISEVSGEVGS